MNKLEFCNQLVIRCDERIEDLTAKVERYKNTWSQSNYEWHLDLVRINVKARESAIKHARYLRTYGVKG